MKHLLLSLIILVFSSLSFAGLKPQNCFQTLLGRADIEVQHELVTYIDELFGIEVELNERHLSLETSQAAAASIAAKDFWSRIKEFSFSRSLKEDIEVDKLWISQLEKERETVGTKLKEIEKQILSSDPVLKRRFEMLDHLSHTKKGLTNKIIQSVYESFILSIYLGAKVSEVVIRSTGNMELAAVGEIASLVAAGSSTFTTHLGAGLKSSVDRDVAQIIGMLQALNSSSDADIEALQQQINVHGGIVMSEIAEGFLDSTTFVAEGMNAVSAGSFQGSDGEIMSIANIGIAGNKIKKLLQQVKADGKKKEVIERFRLELQNQQNQLLCKFHGFCVRKVESSINN